MFPLTHAIAPKTVKKYLKIVGWVCVGILLQLRFDVLYEIVCLENLGFHTRLYTIKMNLVPTEESVRVLHIETSARYTLGKDYFVYIYIPTQYKVVNKAPYLRAEAIPGYQVYAMDMKRKYRDVQATTDFVIALRNLDENVSPTPILVHFENTKQRLHADKTYLLSTASKHTQLEGPPMIEVKYPQQWGL